MMRHARLPVLWAAAYERFDVEPGGTAMLLVDKDTTVKRRADDPAPMSELFARIDGMPMRQREMREVHDASP